VLRCKAFLESKTAPKEELLAALAALHKMGSLPTKILGDTLIGKAVNALAKGAADEAVRNRAKDLVEAWRQMHRKRKAGSDVQEPGPLKRSLSASQSLGSEAPPASQESVSGSQPAAASSEFMFGIPIGEFVLVQQAQQSLSRTDSLLSSMGEESLDAGGIATYREKVLQKLVEAFGKEEEIEAKDGVTGGEERMRDPVKLATEIDEALHVACPSKEPYLAQARSILYNLKDKKNHTFRFKLMVGFYKPQDVPKLSAEDMASDEKNAERAKQRKYAMEEIQSDWAIKNGQQRITGMFTCGKCKGVKTTYFQMQTRSSDEPMTTFVTCLTCNNRWKFC